MATAPEAAEGFILDRDGKFDTYKDNRSTLINKIASYTGSTANALLIKGANGREWWIIFVTNRALIPNSPSPYDISIKGNGIHIVYENGSTASGYSAARWKSECSSAPQNLLRGVSKIEFYGKSAAPDNKMAINNVVQKNTVNQADDIADIEEISKSDFDKLCEKMAAFSEFMNI